MLLLAYLLGVVTPAVAVLVMCWTAAIKHGWWTRYDNGGCDACRGCPPDQWSPFHVCPRCGVRYVRTYLIRVLGERLTLLLMPARGPEDEAWLRGETDE